MHQGIEEQTHFVHIEYCKSCQSHNWCTHHNEAKYRQAYLDLATDIRKMFPELAVQGNQLPPGYVPVKAKENKFFDSANKKYVIFPAIGAFEVTFDNNLLFSKKESNNWPTNSEIIKAISQQLNKQNPSTNTKPFEQASAHSQDEVKTEKHTIAVANQFLQNLNTNSAFYKKDIKHEFTLTDHFKRYKMKQNSKPEEYDSLYAESEPETKNNRVSKLTPEDIKNLHDLWGKKSSLPNFFKEKAYIHQQKGKKQMLVNLSSIEEQNYIKDKQNTKGGYVPLKTRSDFSTSNMKDKHSILEKDFDQLEKKFRKFQHKVSVVHSKDFNKSNESFDLNQHKFTVANQLKPKFSIADKIKEVTYTYNGQQLLKQIKDRKKRKIQEYIQASTDYKNEQLEEIYGKQMIKKHPSNPAKKFVGKKYKKRQIINNGGQRQERASSSDSADSGQLSSRLVGEQDSNTDIQIPVIERKQSVSVHSQKNKVQHLRQQSQPKGKQNTNINTRLPRQSNNRQNSALRSTGQNFRKTQNRQANNAGRSKHSQSELYKMPPPIRGNVVGKKFEKPQEDSFSDSSPSQRSLSAVNPSMRSKGKKRQASKQPQLATKASPPTYNFKKSSLDFNPVSSSNQSSQLKKIKKVQDKRSLESKSSQRKGSADKHSVSPNQKKKPIKGRQLKTGKIQEADSDAECSFEKSRDNQNRGSDATQVLVDGVRISNDSSMSNSQQFSNKTKIKMDKGQQPVDKAFKRKRQNRDSATTLHSKSTVKNKKAAKKPNKQQKGESYFKVKGQTVEETDIKQISKDSDSNSEVQSQQESLISEKESKPAPPVVKKASKDKIQTKKQKKQKKTAVSKDTKAQSPQQKKDKSKKVESPAPKKKNAAAMKSKSKTKSKREQQSANQQAGSEEEESLDKSSPHQPIQNKSNFSNKSDKSPTKSIKKSKSTKQTKDKVDQNGQKQPDTQKQPNNVGTSSVVVNQSTKRERLLIDKSDMGVQVSQQHEDKTKTQTMDKSTHIKDQSPPRVSKSKSKKEKVVSIQNEKPKSISSTSKETLQKPINKQEKSTSKQLSHMSSKGKSSKLSEYEESVSQESNIPKSHHKIKQVQAKIVSQLYGENYHELIKQAQLTQHIKTNQSDKTLKDVYPSGVLFGRQDIEPDNIIDQSGKLTHLIKVIRMLCARNQYIIVRLFDNPEVNYSDQYCVWVCDQYRWKCIKVDNTVGGFHLRHKNGQFWPIILEKVLTQLFESFEELARASIAEIFHALTGSNSLTFKVKEDPSKNKNLLKFITANEKKNFILYTQKRLLNSINEQAQSQSDIFTILSQKTVTSNADSEILLRMKKEGKDAFWIKLDKFVSEFSRVDVLQLRINHNFSYIDLNNCKTESFNVIEMDFREDSFGSLAVVNGLTFTDFVVYLYREEEDNVLRLIGQLKEKNKKYAFFDCCFESGKYLIFVETKHPQCHVSFMGQSTPLLKIREQIHGKGLKNDYTEYVPIDSMPKKQSHQMPKYLSATFKGQNERSVNLHEQPSIRNKSELKSQFINFLVNS